MKNQILLTVITVFIGIGSFGQGSSFPVNQPDYSKPRLFSNYAAKIAISPEEISGIFNVAAGQHVEAKFAGGAFKVAGEVAARVSKFENRLISMVIRSSNFPGANLVVHKQTAEDGTVIYSGSMISRNHGDAYLLKLENGVYVFTRQNTPDLLIE